MIEKSEYCTGIMKKHFKKELAMIKKKKMEILKTLLSIGFVIMFMLEVVQK